MSVDVSPVNYSDSELDLIATRCNLTARAVIDDCPKRDTNRLCTRKETAFRRIKEFSLP